MIKVKFKNSHRVMGSHDLRKTAMGLERVHFPESACNRESERGRKGEREREKRREAAELGREGKEQEAFIRS